MFMWAYRDADTQNSSSSNISAVVDRTIVQPHRLQVVAEHFDLESVWIWTVTYEMKSKQFYTNENAKVAICF